MAAIAIFMAVLSIVAMFSELATERPLREVCRRSVRPFTEVTASERQLIGRCSVLHHVQLSAFFDDKASVVYLDVVHGPYSVQHGHQ